MTGARKGTRKGTLSSIVFVRVTPEEKLMLEGRAERAGVTVSTYARRVITGSSEEERSARMQSLTERVLMNVMIRLLRGESVTEQWIKDAEGQCLAKADEALARRWKLLGRSVDGEA